MVQRSAGLLLFRQRVGVEVLLVHPGGPFWVKKDDGAWSIPKGLCDEGEDELAAAQREFAEETGAVATAPFIPLGTFKQPSGKLIAAWAAEGDFDTAQLKSNFFSMEWPPKSKKMSSFPEVDRAGWFAPADAVRKILKGQVAILNALLTHLGLPVQTI